MALRDMYLGVPVSYSPWLEVGQAYLVRSGALGRLIIGTGPRRPTTLGRLAAKRWVRNELWRRRMAR